MIQTQHVNEVRAKESSILIIGGFLLGVIITMALWKFYGAIGLISAIVPTWIWKEEQNSVRAFNSYLLK